MIDPGLAGKVVLVTGANNPFGMGAAIAEAFVAQDAAVFLTYLRQSPELFRDFCRGRFAAASTPEGSTAPATPIPPTL